MKKLCCILLALMLTFSVALTAINLLPNVLDLIYSLLRIINVHFYLEIVHSFFNFLYSAVSLAKTVLFLLLGAAALLNKEIKIPVLDPVIEKFAN